MVLGRVELASRGEERSGGVFDGGGTAVGFSGAGECGLPSREVLALRGHGAIVADAIPVDQAELDGLVSAYVEHSRQAGCPAVVAQRRTFTADPD
jgi:hypothetical protein